MPLKFEPGGPPPSALFRFWKFPGADHTIDCLGGTIKPAHFPHTPVETHAWHDFQAAHWIVYPIVEDKTDVIPIMLAYTSVQAAPTTG